MAQMRALEAGRWMIRATNNGITVLIDPMGASPSRFRSSNRPCCMASHANAGLTPYLRWRSRPLIAVCVLLLGWALVRRKSA